MEETNDKQTKDCSRDPSAVEDNRVDADGGRWVSIEAGWKATLSEEHWS